MTGRRFFAVVWRVNAVLILLTTVLACAVLAFAAREIFKEAIRARQATGVVNVAEEQVDRSRAELGKFEIVRGTRLLRAPLQIEQTYGFSSGSKEATSVQNYLFYDPSDGSSHWLLPGNKGLFLSEHELPEREYSKPEPPLIAVVYELVEVDTNGDKKLTASDAKAVAVSDPSGSRFTRRLTGVEEVHGTTLTTNGNILILYTAASTLKAAEIDVGSLKIVRDGPVQPLRKQVGAAAQR